MGWQRARRPEQKEQRRKDILAAAAEIYDEGGLETASLSRIAERAGLSKASFYGYYDSRETVYLHLLIDEYEAFTQQVEEQLAPLAGSDDAEAVVDVLVQAQQDHPRLPSLKAHLPGVLERHAAPCSVVEFKRHWFAFARRSSNAIAVALPTISAEQAQSLVAMLHYLVVGIWPSTHLPEEVKTAIVDAKLGFAPLEFYGELRRHLICYTHGLFTDARADS